MGGMVEPNAALLRALVELRMTLRQALEAPLVAGLALTVR